MDSLQPQVASLLGMRGLDDFNKILAAHNRRPSVAQIRDLKPKLFESGTHARALTAD